MEMSEVKISSCINSDHEYLAGRDNFIKKCIDNGSNYSEVLNNKLKFVKSINGNQYKQLFNYEDEYGYQRYYTIHTYNPEYHQACQYKPYESLGFHSDENGNPLCENSDPFNNGDVNNTGTHLNETHYATIYDIMYISLYFWDNEIWSDDD